ncbi:MAG: TlpA family protein disulfide reductase [Phaeodactylibacter sp.]|nr:TlpA family protein disulfide reductase [Phaeodactylibacter sp.]MCB9297268.1 TlpA family protein disulfide reductase [Lewinellaceae bacterium]
MENFTRLTPVVCGLAIILFSCNASPATGQDQAASASSAPAAQENNTEWPPPAAYIGGIPIYEEFSQAEPFFHFDNDTTYVVNFWATWCKPCVEELPYFEELTRAYEGQAVRVILVSLDFPRQFKTKLAPFVGERQLQSAVIALADGRYNDWIDKVSTEWTGAIPATYVYKRDKSRFIGTSVKSMAELEAAIRSL